MRQITKKYIFEQKLKGEPVVIPWSKEPWSSEMRNLGVLVKYDILEDCGNDRFKVCYPVTMHGSYYTEYLNNRMDGWTVLPVGARIAKPGDMWTLK